MRRFVRLALASLLLALAVPLAPPVAQAEDGAILSKILERGKLRVGMSGDQPPLNMKNKSGEIIGIEADLARVLAASMKLELQIVEKPFGDLLPALGNGEVDMVISGVTITPERNLLAAFVGPYFISGKSILTKVGPLADADEPEDINAENLKLAALAGSTSEEFVRALAPKSKLVPIENYDQGIQMVLDGKVTALVADQPACVLAVLRNPGSGLASLVTPLTVEPIGIAVPPGDPLLVNLIDNYITALEGSGLLERIRTRWLDDATWLRDLP